LISGRLSSLSQAHGYERSIALNRGGNGEEDTVELNGAEAGRVSPLRGLFKKKFDVNEE
jgi:hypothetical protein